ncbi:hypothetical protein BJ138DRAFT_1114488 [Hygrophoropsis aurantiaca]|uniref:Uncharacterized protein n=1 Tax=Hygrophoropsis aurantiaca TaxID=72124 RepID=A0ACB8AA82_9AGAM|nr:hypothetical protein BJ138DRAFT_1114488 [Hygrophoropsis aurantiaca]
MIKPLRRPSRARSRRMASSLSFAFLAFIAIICLCPAVAAQDSTDKSQYGTVIGIDLGTTAEVGLKSLPTIKVIV